MANPTPCTGFRALREYRDNPAMTETPFFETELLSGFLQARKGGNS